MKEMTPEGLAIKYHNAMETIIADEPNTRPRPKAWDELSVNHRLRLTKTAKLFLSRYRVLSRRELVNK